MSIPIDGWVGYVRDSIDEYTSTEVVETDSEYTVRYSIETPALPPLPKRTARAALSPYWISKSDDGTKTQVPWHAIYRDHRQTVTSQGATCEHCSDNLSRRQCDKGWKTPHPRDGIVVGVPFEGRMLFGWYVRFQHSRNRLVRLPVQVCKSVRHEMDADEELCKSSLNINFPEATFERGLVDFDAVAALRFERVKANLVKVNFVQKRKRACSNLDENLCDKNKRQLSTTSKTNNADSRGTCSVCLEDAEIVGHKCCGATSSTCSDCFAKLRGYCPVCERSDINAQYSCANCQASVTLRQYGFPCLTCERRVLCACCYNSFGECDECDILRDTE